MADHLGPKTKTEHSEDTQVLKESLDSWPLAWKVCLMWKSCRNWNLAGGSHTGNSEHHPAFPPSCLTEATCKPSFPPLAFAGS
jgi:hypothetical protein